MTNRAGSTLAGVLLATLIGVFVGVSAVTFRYAEGLSYLSNDPKTCVNCHIMRDQFDGWQKSPHHAVATCNDCHVPQNFIGKYYTKATHGWRHSKGFTLQDFHEPIQMKPDSRAVVVENCLRCHTELVSDIAGADAHGDGIDCIKCHAGMGHGPRR
jgi:cytochrome c nitrite reductase small subunit